MSQRSPIARAYCTNGLWALALLACLPLPRNAVADETTGVLCRGTRFETQYYVRRAATPGPTVVITGGLHGDEPAGAAAAEQIRHWPIQCGTLAVLPRANPPGLDAHTRLMPDLEKSRNNLNRNFPKAATAGPAVGEPAVAVWTWVQSLKPDWVIDLHEGTEPRASGSKSVGASAIVCDSAEANAAAERMLQAVNADITDARARFVKIGPPVDGSLARAAGVHLGVKAMILETPIRAPATVEPAAAGDKSGGKSADKKSTAGPGKEYPLSTRIRQHRLMIGALLKHLGMLDPTANPNRVAGKSADPAGTWAAIYDAGGTGGRGGSSVERILSADGLRVVRVGPEEIAADSLREFQLLVVPGGSGSREAASIGPAGRETIVRFVTQGGGYIGICAGAYLCTSGYDWSLKIINAKTLSPRWNRGVGDVKLELSDEGKRVLGDRSGQFAVRYANGPVVGPGGMKDMPAYEVLAWFRSELAEHGTPAGVMVNSPAIAIARFGNGKVVFCSPHPEQTPGLESFIAGAARWAVGKSAANSSSR